MLLHTNMTPRGREQLDSTSVSVEEETAMQSGNTDDHLPTQPSPTSTKLKPRRLSAFRLHKTGPGKQHRNRRRSFPRPRNQEIPTTTAENEEADHVSLIEQNHQHLNQDRETDSDDGNIHRLSPEAESSTFNHHRTSNPKRSGGLLRRWRSDSTRQGPTNSQPSSAENAPQSLVSEDDLKTTRVFTVRAMKRNEEAPNADEEFTRQGSRGVALFDGDDQEEIPEQLTVANQNLQASNAALSNSMCATAILQHSYLETLCGSPHSDCESNECWKEDDDILEFSTKMNLNNQRRHKKQISDDPTVQESIECVFASTLNENLALMLQEDDVEERQSESPCHHLVQESTGRGALVAPSGLQQSLLRNRSDRGLGQDSYFSPVRPRPRNHKRQESLKLAHVGTYDPTGNTPDTLSTREAGAKSANINTAARSSRECICCKQKTPIVGADRWPQRPILLRPTPSSGTVVKGIRRAGSTDYLWESNSSDQSNLTWPSTLRREWGMDASDTKTNPMEVMCPRCMILPINNGNEGPGEALVTDFESELFEGSLLLRLRKSEGTTPQPYSDDFGYFHGMNRRYQALIRGRFKAAVPWTECTTGFTLDRPCGKLPPKWILKGGLKVLSFFAPQLQAKLDGPSPSSLAPLGSTPQVLSVHESESDIDAIDTMKYEPTERKHTLLDEAFVSTASLQRARHRKKRFDKLFTEKSRTPLTDPNKIYTFEFLQHLFNFNEFSIDLGAMLGSIPLQELLDGQPLQIMAQHQTQHQCHKLWSFDVWHTALLVDAEKHDKLANK